MITFLADRLAQPDAPIIYYIHPREIDVEQPRLPMPFNRRFRSYVNLSSTRGKIKALCRRYEFERMIDWVEANETRLPTLSGQMHATA